jgi:DNA-binding transcriptional MerR regulator
MTQPGDTASTQQQQPPHLFRIGELAHRAGVSKQTVQYYIMIGLLDGVDCTAGGRRLFDIAAVRRVRLIHRLNKSGYTLRDIRETFIDRLPGQAQ